MRLEEGPGRLREAAGAGPDRLRSASVAAAARIVGGTRSFHRLSRRHPGRSRRRDGREAAAPAAARRTRRPPGGPGRVREEPTGNLPKLPWSTTVPVYERPAGAGPGPAPRRTIGAPSSAVVRSAAVGPAPAPFGAGAAAPAAAAARGVMKSPPSAPRRHHPPSPTPRAPKASLRDGPGVSSGRSRRVGSSSGRADPRPGDGGVAPLGGALAGARRASAPPTGGASVPARASRSPNLRERRVRSRSPPRPSSRPSPPRPHRGRTALVRAPQDGSRDSASEKPFHPRGRRRLFAMSRADGAAPAGYDRASVRGNGSAAGFRRGRSRVCRAARAPPRGASAVCSSRPRGGSDTRATPSRGARRARGALVAAVITRRQ